MFSNVNSRASDLFGFRSFLHRASLYMPTANCHNPAMKRLTASLFSFFVALFFAGCLTTPVADSGGVGAVTVTNTSVNRITAAAQNVFAQSGYSPGPVNYPAWVAFDKPATGFSNAMWGGYDRKTTIRARLYMTQIPGTNNYRLSTRIYAVANPGEPGFEDKHQLSGIWASEFGPLLQKIKTQASGASRGF